MNAPPRRPRLHVVAVSHLDTQWRWTIRDTIERHLPATLAENFRRFEEFPNYVVAFDGSFRYRLIEQCYPEAFVALERWVRAGRWTVAGAFVDAADVNLPHPESLVRHVLLATRYFRQRFGLRPRDIFLPDCFGFGAALPTVAAHCGLNGFSSQKLGRGRASGPLPFALGVWEGVDGSEIVASLDPGGYGEMLQGDLSRDARPDGPPVAQRYFGVGDTGGAPGAASLAWLERSLTSRGEIEVRVGESARLFDDLGEDERRDLPRHRGELLMRLHGPGCYTSLAPMKRWNRRNERLARTAEAVALAAHQVAGVPYPHRKLNAAWERFLWHQFHDDLTGTSVPAAYSYSLRDEALSHADFSDVLRSRFEAVVAELETATQGIPLVVFNPLACDREDLVEFEFEGREGAREALAARAPDGLIVACQRVDRPGARSRWIFPARVAGLSFAVFEILDGVGTDTPALPCGGEISPRAIAQGEFRVGIDEQGRLASLTSSGREYLGRPIELQFLPDVSRRFPAWEIRYEDVSAQPLAMVSGPTRIEVEDAGPWRLRLRVERSAEGSTFVDHVELAQGFPGVQVWSEVDWRTRGRLLKLAVSAPWSDAQATYGLGWGAIERGVNTPESYEVPAQQWTNLQSPAACQGLGILEDCKFGWDRPAAETLRMTWFHTPTVGRRFRFQGRQDLGRHEIRWALVPHQGSWGEGGLPLVADRFENPLIAKQVERHEGRLGRSYRLLEVEGRGVTVSALKLAEDGRGAVVRLRESIRRSVRVALRFDGAVGATEEIDGAEEVRVGRAPVSPLEASGDTVAFELAPFATRAFRVEAATVPSARVPWLPLQLARDARVTAVRGDRSASGFDADGFAFVEDLFPVGEFEDGGIPFHLAAPGESNAWLIEKATLELPENAERIALLLTAPAPVWARFGWSNEPATPRIRVPGFRDQDAVGAALPVAWVSPHLLRRGRLMGYQFGYLFRLELVRPRAAASLQITSDGPLAFLAAATRASRR